MDRYPHSLCGYIDPIGTGNRFIRVDVWEVVVCVFIKVEYDITLAQIRHDVAVAVSHNAVGEDNALKEADHSAHEFLSIRSG